MWQFIQELTDKVISEGEITPEQADKLLSVDKQDLFYLFASANRIRQNFRGDKVSLCAITNAKSGDCFEDCKFCAQSRHYNTNVSVYPLITPDEMVKRAERAVEGGISRFCFVTSGCKLDENEIESLCAGIARVREKLPDLKLDASLGKIDLVSAKRLKGSGLNRYNHNIETVPELFPEICSTHTFEDRLSTIKILKEAGLEVCCGGIFGMGETARQRIEFGLILKGLGIDSAAINFLNPVQGTALDEMPVLTPLEILKILAILRFILPKKELRLCGGRQRNLGNLQALAFTSGADATITGDYLTTKGSSPAEDIRMFQDLGFSV